MTFKCFSSCLRLVLSIVVLANFSEIRMIIYGLALVGIMIFKPTGILGTKELSFKKLFDKRKEKSA